MFSDHCLVIYLITNKMPHLFKSTVNFLQHEGFQHFQHTLRSRWGQVLLCPSQGNFYSEDSVDREEDIRYRRHSAPHTPSLNTDSSFNASILPTVIFPLPEHTAANGSEKFRRMASCYLVLLFHLIEVHEPPKFHSIRNKLKVLFCQLQQILCTCQQNKHWDNWGFLM